MVSKSSPDYAAMSDDELHGSLHELMQLRHGVGRELDEEAGLSELRLYQIELEMQNRELSASQEVLEESRAHYAELYDYAPVGFVTVDAAGIILDINLTAASLLGRERRQLVGQPIGVLLAQGSSQALLSFLRSIPQRLPAEMPVRLEVKSRDDGGGARDLRLVGATRHLPGLDNAVRRLAIYDVTDELLQQESLRLHSLIMENMREGVLLLRQRDGVIIETNPACDQMYGYATGELCGLNIGVLDACGESTEVVPFSRLLNDSGLEPSLDWEGEYLRKDGSSFWCEVSAFNFTHIQYGHVWLVVQRDATVRRLAERQSRMHEAKLAQVMRLNTVGELAASLAHELTQPLMTVQHVNHAAIGMLQQSPGQEAVLELLRSTEKQLQRASDIILNMRKFIRQGSLETRSTAVVELLDVSLALTRPLLHENLITIALPNEVPQLAVEVEAVQIEQVLVNLISNSAQAMIKAKSVRRHIDISVELQGTMVKVAVHDSGPGLPAGTSEELFDVLKTNKEDGMGMGLAISRSLIQGHGGRLWADDQAEGGACFCFTLPVANHQGEDGE